MRERAGALRTEIEALVDLEDPNPGQTQRLEDALTATEKVLGPIDAAVRCDDIK